MDTEFRDKVSRAIATGLACDLADGGRANEKDGNPTLPGTLGTYPALRGTVVRCCGGPTSDHPAVARYLSALRGFGFWR